MSKAKQTIVPRPGTPAPAPAAQREVVINVNKNVLFTLTLVVGALVMLLGGFVVGQAVFRPRTAATTSAPAANAPAGAAGLPSALQQPGISGEPSGVQLKPANPDPNALHPNLEGYAPVPVSAAPVAKGAPRLAVGGLDPKFTLDMGQLQSGEKKQYTFDVKNVGEGDLTIYKIYAGCGCTAGEFAGQPVNDDPEFAFNPPVVIKPGQSLPLTVTYDSGALSDQGEIDKFIQIFSNDPTAKEFEKGFRETRFRLTGTVQ